MSIDISCPTSLLVGQLRFCFSNAHYADGSTRVVAPDWSSSDPGIASISPLANAGALTGRAAGQTLVKSLYGGRAASALVSVRAEDFLTVTSASIQGTFQTGRTVTMWVQGEYGVASAVAGELNIEISDQNGRRVAAGTPQTVPNGGDSYILSSTFVIPAATTQVCRTAVLQIGPVRLTAVGSAGLFPCINVAS